MSLRDPYGDPAPGSHASMTATVTALLPFTARSVTAAAVRLEHELALYRIETDVRST